MCRFIAYSGPATVMKDYLFSASNCLVNQSKKSTMRANPLNADGFGIGWYPEHNDETPGTFVSIEPAWSNRNLTQLANKILTRHFFAHVRDASVGMPVALSNCHPFQYGPYLWMHNGRLDQFNSFRRLILNDLSDQAFDFIQGNTDSEYAFAMFLDEINFAADVSESQLKQAMVNTIKKIMQYRKIAGADTNAFINFAVSNGKYSIFTRFATKSDVRPASLFYQHVNDTVIVSSEPLEHHRENWVKVERSSLLSVSPNQINIEDLGIPFQDC